MRLDLEGRAVIVTGASKGVGAATAEMLSAEGARLLLVARSAERLAEVADRCEGEVETLALDVRTLAAGQIISTALECFGRLDGLVNNAGAVRVVPPQEQRSAEWWEQLNLHVIAPMRLMRAAAPVMARAGWGRIVNVCSTASRQPSQMNVAYSVAKAAELSLSRAFADEWAGQGVLVNAVTPGVVESPMWLDEGGVADQLATAEGVSRDQVLARVGTEAPIGRLASEQEIAAVIVFLCSGLASNVAGAAWAVDGGAIPTIS